MDHSRKKRILILGAGFGGLYTVLALEKLLKRYDDYEIVLINRENYFVYQPMLAEIISGHVGVFDTVSPLRQLLRRTEVVVRDVQKIDLENRLVTVSPGFRQVQRHIPYDYLVLALGNVTDFRGLTGLTQHALPFKTMADALHLRHHVIHILEEASIEQDPELRKALLTFVVAGGGWSGVECIAELNSLVRRVARTYRNIDPAEINVILLHSGETILDQLMPQLRLLAQKVLQQDGVTIRFKSRLTAATGSEAIINGTEKIAARTLVSTVPSSPNPIIDSLDLPKQSGRIKTDRYMQVIGSDHIYAVGDCAAIPDPADPTLSHACPPTAQHAVRQGNVCAHNIVADLRGGQKKTFNFKGLGTMGALGRHSAVAQIFGFRISGLPAWLMWRTVYLMKMPGWDRKIRTVSAWMLSMILPPDIVGLKVDQNRGVVEEHYEAGEVVFNQDDLGDRLYIIKKGCCEVVRTENGVARKLATLEQGQYFGEMALINKTVRNATVRATEPLDVLSVPRSDLSALIDDLPALRESFQAVITHREMLNGPEEDALQLLPTMQNLQCLGEAVVREESNAKF